MGCLNEEGWVVFRAVGPFLQTVCGNLWAAQTRHTPFYTHIYYKPSATRLLLHGRLRRWGWIHGGMDWKKKMEEYIKIYKCINTYFPNTKISKHKTMLLSWSEYVEPEVLQLEVDSSYTYTIVYAPFLPFHSNFWRKTLPWSRLYILSSAWLTESSRVWWRTDAGVCK